MLHRLLRIGIRVGLIGGVAVVVVRVLTERRSSTGSPMPAATWTPLQPDPTPKPVATKPVATKPTASAWVEPTGNVCPTTHPVKAKLSSKIFHLPGMMAYDRTRPDRCYRDGAAAESDGLRAAKR